LWLLVGGLAAGQFHHSNTLAVVVEREDLEQAQEYLYPQERSTLLPLVLAAQAVQIPEILDLILQLLVGRVRLLLLVLFLLAAVVALLELLLTILPTVHKMVVLVVVQHIPLHNREHLVIHLAHLHPRVIMVGMAQAIRDLLGDMVVVVVVQVGLEVIVIVPLLQQQVLTMLDLADQGKHQVLQA